MRKALTIAGLAAVLLAGVAAAREWTPGYGPGGWGGPMTGMPMWGMGPGGMWGPRGWQGAPPQGRDMAAMMEWCRQMMTAWMQPPREAPDRRPPQGDPERR